MAAAKITELTAATAVAPSTDLLAVVDVSDTTMAASGTTKKITQAALLTAEAPATAASSTAGNSVALTASAATAGNTNAGAAAGGAVTITSGAAARLTSGNANGGNINLVTGAGIGTGTAGQVLVPTGTAAVPSLAFTAGSTYGLYLESGVLLGLIGGGSINIYVGSSSTTVRKPIQFNSANAANNRLYGNTRNVLAKTNGVGSPFSAVIDDSSIVFTNEGATALVYISLPTATANLTYDFCVQDADGLRITAATGDTIRVRDKVTATGGYIQSTTIGSIVRLVAINATEWFAMEIGGVFTDGTFTYDDTSLTTP